MTVKQVEMELKSLGWSLRSIYHCYKYYWAVMAERDEDGEIESADGTTRMMALERLVVSARQRNNIQKAVKASEPKP
jgi:hypothetical protein